jgi:hypothetical protein
MGRTYVFECQECGYCAKVAGGTAEGIEFAVQTIHCVDCRKLQDAVMYAAMPIIDPFVGGQEPKGKSMPPPLTKLMTRLPFASRLATRPQKFELACAASPDHRIRVWNQPGKCPQCGVFLERSGFPFAQWD